MFEYLIKKLDPMPLSLKTTLFNLLGLKAFFIKNNIFIGNHTSGSEKIVKPRSDGKLDKKSSDQV
ncbi:hypothetical protein BpHYR1_044503 [Brachionus plicatilis]|uniref:Uncharacterized protein n=1 Tax=Brachionus plicatilis TaxID=10195 RepID=A0A3M7SZG9_BRAPC|nr:hypothetical protein BpHYR1_044503 [Brachionus plicatilis]